MNEYKVFNILDMAEAIGETNPKELLSDFSCPKNVLLKYFLPDRIKLLINAVNIEIPHISFDTSCRK